MPRAAVMPAAAVFTVDKPVDGPRRGFSLPAHMRIITITAAAVLASAGFTVAQDDAAKPETKPAAEPPTAEASAADVSYSIGTMIAGNLKQQGVPVDLAELTKGISDVLEGKKPRLDQAQVQGVMMAFQQKQMKAQEEKAAA